jgi:predicted permease
VVQVALAMVLVAGAGVLARSLRNVQSVRLGFEPTGVSTTQLALPGSRYPGRGAVIAFVDALLERVGHFPGVRSVAAASAVPLVGPNSGTVLAVVGRPAPGPGEGTGADYRVVTPGYFATLGIPILRGRDFVPADDSTGPRVVIVSARTARQLWPAGDAIGSRIRISDLAAGPEFEVVGVVGDHRYWTLDQPEPRPLLFFPFRRQGQPEMTLVVGATGDPGPLAAGLRAAIRELDPELPMGEVRSMAGIVDQTLGRRRFNVVVAVVLAAVTLVLAVAGLSGVMAATVAERSRELGIRMALGANRRRLVGSVLRRALTLVGAGTLLGLGGVVALNRALATLLYQVRPTDLATLAGTALILIIAGLLGTALPARRAARLDPLEVLRRQ